MTVQGLVKSILSLDEQYAKETKVMKTQESLQIQSKIMQKGIMLANKIGGSKKTLESLDIESRILLSTIRKSVAALNTTKTENLKEMSLADAVDHWDAIHSATVALALKFQEKPENASI